MSQDDILNLQDGRAKVFAMIFFIAASSYVHPSNTAQDVTPVFALYLFLLMIYISDSSV